MADEELLAELKAADEQVGQVSLETRQEASYYWSDGVNALTAEYYPKIDGAVAKKDKTLTGQLAGELKRKIQQEYALLEQKRDLPDFAEQVQAFEHFRQGDLEQYFRDVKTACDVMPEGGMPTGEMPVEAPQPEPKVEVRFEVFKDFQESFENDASRIPLSDPDRNQKIDKVLKFYIDRLQTAAKEEKVKQFKASQGL